MLGKIFTGIELNFSLNPDEAIAYGATLRAKQIITNDIPSVKLNEANAKRLKNTLLCVPQNALIDVSLPPEVPPTSFSTSDAYEANLHSEKLTNSGSTSRLSDNTILPMKQPDVVFIRREQPNNIVLPPKIEVIPRSGFVSSAENLSDQEKIQRFTTMSDESTKAKEKTNLKLDLEKTKKVQLPEKVELIQKPEKIDKHDLVMKEIKVEQNKYNFPIKRSTPDDSSNANDVKGIHKSNPTDPMVNMIPFGKLELNKTVEENIRKFDSQSQTIKLEREVTRSDSKTKLTQTIQPKNHKSDNLPDLGIALYNLNAPKPNEEETTKRFEENFKKFNQPPQKVSSQQEKIDCINATQNSKKSDNLPYTGVTKYKENFIKLNTESSSPSSSTPRITEKNAPSDSFSLNPQQEKIDSIKATKNTKKSDNLPYTGVTKYKENFMKPNTKSSSPSSVTSPKITVPSYYFPFKNEAVRMVNIQKPQLKNLHSTSEKYAVMNYNMKNSSKSSLTNSDGSSNNNNQTNIETTNDHFKRQLIYETIKAIRDEVSLFKYISVNEQNAFDEAYSVENLNHIDIESLYKKLAEAYKDKKRLHEANKLEQKRNGIYLQKYRKIQQIINTANNDQPLEMLKYRAALEVCVKITREAHTKTIKEPSEDNVIFEKYILDMRIGASCLQNNLKESILAVLNLDDKV